jgi:DNA-binding LacI/PurR family transcriptional regulator
MTAERLFNVQRQEHLLGELRRHGAVRVRELARALGVSELTIRRDIAVLAERNLLTKVHGGATLPGPTSAARRRRTPRRFTLGMVVPSLDFYWPQIIGGAKAAAAALGVTLRLRGSSYDPDEDRRQIGRLVDEGQVQGLLLAPSFTGEHASAMVGWIARLPVPTILVEREPPGWAATPRPLEWVRSDHALGLETAVHHLHQCGHRRLGIVLSEHSPTSAYLEQGWRTGCADVGVGDAMVVRAPDALTTTAIRTLLAECRRAKVSALIIHSDPVAVAVARFCAEHGVAVPDDLAIVSYDDEIAHLAEPMLTAIRPPKTHVGRVAVELMVSRLLDGERRPSQRVLVAPELIVRQSSIPQR